MRILVVDDELVSRAKLVKILGAYGQCDGASDGPEALEFIEAALAEGRPYDLVTLDVSMPGMDGMSLLQKLRRMERADPAAGGGGSKVLMISAHAQRSVVVECVQYGCDDYLIKPFKPEQIVKKLRIFGLLR